jgi:hypothetical protein
MLPLPQTTGEIGIDLLDLNNEICLKKLMERSVKRDTQTNFARGKTVRSRHGSGREQKYQGYCESTNKHC